MSESTLVDLDELERVAKAADFEWELTKHGLSDEEGSGFREYARAAKPAVVLSLIAEVRAARAPREAGAVTEKHRAFALSLWGSVAMDAWMLRWLKTGELDERHAHLMEAAKRLADFEAEAEARGRAQAVDPKHGDLLSVGERVGSKP